MTKVKGRKKSLIKINLLKIFHSLVFVFKQDNILELEYTVQGDIFKVSLRVTKRTLVGINTVKEAKKLHILLINWTPGSLSRNCFSLRLQRAYIAR